MMEQEDLRAHSHREEIKSKSDLVLSALPSGNVLCDLRLQRQQSVKQGLCLSDLAGNIHVGVLPEGFRVIHGGK